MHVLFLPVQEPIIEVEVRVDCSAVSLECTPVPMIVIQKQKNYFFPWQVSVCKCLGNALMYTHKNITNFQARSFMELNHIKNIYRISLNNI